MRKIFISFLGTNNYIPCNYYVETNPDEKVSGVRFVQEAIIQLYCRGFNKEDVFLCFNTEDALNKNWNNGKHWNPLSKQLEVFSGLEERLESIKDKGLYEGLYKSVSIPEGHSAEEVWQIFEIISGELQDGDSVLLDITHSFRSIPLLGIILLNYCRVVKNIKVELILYGAFEVLGNARDVISMKLEDRNAPLVDLTSFIELQDWITAASDFKNYGKSDKVISLSSERIRPVLRETKGSNLSARDGRDINNRLSEMSKILETNRGKDLDDFDFNLLGKQLKDYSTEIISLTPFSHLIDLIDGKLNQYFDSTRPVWLNAAKWSMDHGLIQQAFTQLQEGMITWMIIQAKGITGSSYFDFTKRKPREFSSSLLNNIPKEDWKGELFEKRELAEIILENIDIAKISKLYKNLSQFRNDINHGGWTNKSMVATRFYQQLKKLIDKTDSFIKSYNSVDHIKDYPNLLVNISNHPFETWLDDQKAAAKDIYSEIIDYKLPNIDPGIEIDDVIDLAMETYNSIVKATDRRPFAVHCHGESTFIYNLIKILEENNIPAFASTTDREVVEHADGSRTYKFKFRGFRTYY